MATAVFDWDHVSFLGHLPKAMGFCDAVLPRRLRKRVARAIEAVLEVDRVDTRAACAPQGPTTLA
jgi:hypothetical protein